MSWLSSREENSTQMSLARKGIITEEMEYIAIRENQNLEENSKLKEDDFIPEKTLAQIFQSFIHLNLSEKKLQVAERLYQQT